MSSFLQKLKNRRKYLQNLLRRRWGRIVEKKERLKRDSFISFGCPWALALVIYCYLTVLNSVVKSNTHFIIANDSMCLLGLLGQLLAACDVGCGCVHLGMWLGGDVSVTPSHGCQGQRLAAGSSAGLLAGHALGLSVWLVLFTAWQLSSQCPQRSKQTLPDLLSSKRGLQSLGLPGKAALPAIGHLCGPEKALYPPASHSPWLRLLSWLCCALALSLSWGFCLFDFFFFNFESFIHGTLKKENYDCQVVVFFWEGYGIFGRKNRTGGSGSLRAGLET